MALHRILAGFLMLDGLCGMVARADEPAIGYLTSSPT